MASVDIQKWRKDNEMDTIHEWYPKSVWYPVLKKYWPCGTLPGQAKGGEAVFVERVGLLDTKSLIRHMPTEELILYHMYQMEVYEQRYLNLVRSV